MITSWGNNWEIQKKIHIINHPSMLSIILKIKRSIYRVFSIKITRMTIMIRPIGPWSWITFWILMKGLHRLMSQWSRKQIKLSIWKVQAWTNKNVRKMAIICKILMILLLKRCLNRWSPSKKKRRVVRGFSLSPQSRNTLKKNSLLIGSKTPKKVRI